MKKLSEYKDEEALEVLADMVEPAVEIFRDKGLVELLRQHDTAKAIATAIKNHKQEVIRIMASLDQTPYEEYHIGLFTLPAQLLTLLNDPDLIRFFEFQAQMDSETSSGSVTENTGEEGL